jgi:hypothetical protein
MVFFFPLRALVPLCEVFFTDKSLISASLIPLSAKEISPTVCFLPKKRLPEPFFLQKVTKTS